MHERRAHFLVLTTQRNGSTWLMSMLNALDDVSAHGELFLPRPRSGEKRWDSDFARARYVESTPIVGRLRPFSVYKYLDAFYDSETTAGFKLMYSQLRLFPEILSYVITRRLRVVHLVRRNHLDVLISFAIKRQIDRAHVLTSEDRPADVTVSIALDSLMRSIRRLQFKHDAARILLRVSRVRHIEVAYEDLVAHTARFHDVCSFLEIPLTAELPRSNIIKTRIGSQRQVITNYDAVRRTLESSRFAYLLE
ncbi:MAG: sulfotransferase domain-containing protein [Gemmatimonadaceae bacterium]|nr:sulfotransferase domain-containing protein [Gemmatimonadaceae bacterium]